MRLTLDLNVLLDVVQKREPFYSGSAAVLGRVVEGEDIGCLPGHALTTLYYVMSKFAGREQAGIVVDWVLTYLEIIPQDRLQFMRARNLDFSDFEDAALASAAEASQCELILTRNVADFSGSPIPVLTPEEFLAAG